MNTSAVGPAASTVRLSSTTWSQKSGTLPRLCVETSIRWPRVAQLAQQVDDRRLGLDVDAGERLVEQDDLALLRQRAGEEHALLLAAADSSPIWRSRIGAHADALERLVDLAAVVRATAMRRKFMWP